MRNLNLQYHRVKKVIDGSVIAVSLDTITPHKYYGIAGQNVYSVDETGTREEFTAQIGKKHPVDLVF